MERRRVLLVVLAVVLVAVAVLIINKSPSDACTPNDWDVNNCVPAGRCTPPGDSREPLIDCMLKDYDHKFNMGE